MRFCGLLIIFLSWIPSAAFAVNFDALFQQAVKEIRSGDLSQAGSHLDEVRSEGNRLGYENFPGYSHGLISLVEEMSSIAVNDKVFLLRLANLLSPTDPEVRLHSGALLIQLQGISAAGEFLAAAGLLRNSPSLLSAIALRTFIAVLAAFTLGLLLLCVVQLARNGSICLQYMAARCSLRNKGVKAILLYFGWVVVPLWFGIAPALAAWSLLLARACRSCRSVALISAVLIVIWGIFPGVFAQVTTASQDPLQRNLERLSNRSFGVSPQVGELPRQITAEPMFRFSQGLHAALEGRFDEGLFLFKDLAGQGGIVGRRAMVNQGILLHRAGKDDEAKVVLQKAESLGEHSFELFGALAEVSIATTDLQAHSKYFALAKELRPNSEFLNLLPEGTVVLATLPVSVLFKRLLSPNAIVGRQERRIDRLERALITYGGLRHVKVLGFATLALALLSFVFPPRLKREVKESEAISWSIVPGGAFLSGRQPVTGLALFTGICALIFVALGIPAPIVVEESVFKQTQFSALILSILLFSSTIVFSVVRGAARGRL